MIAPEVAEHLASAFRAEVRAAERYEATVSELENVTRRGRTSNKRLDALHDASRVARAEWQARRIERLAALDLFRLAAVASTPPRRRARPGRQVEIPT